ncbi:YitT family protein [Isobaculum melis]|uniref:Uncharacterized membrane-anchored protein YitT, contains DUF161 and DUF2179 domains n=1 Tax=Isobaculum melis TaxID=142588 RepID=A0A1H9R8N8_9LACT|nr:YitT family protein [Isobaculum melis]SER69038.1 Uncharacterized membrane-anchored protein YitT, contains DUF161 and DUF2179 domains [Isobaculum melis]
MEKVKLKIHLKDFLTITLGCLFYGFGFVFFNMENQLAEGGFTGVALLIRYWLQIDPAYTTLLLNVPMILIGWKLLGNRSLLYTIYGTVMLSTSIWIWQRVPLTIDIGQDLFIASVLAGLFAGIGCGLIYRVGGTTGGSDIISRILEKYHGLQMGKTLFAFDALVLVLSLSYLDMQHMMYTLVATFIFSRVIDFVQEGAYTARGFLIISDHYDEIAKCLMVELGRGVTYLKAEGAYSKEARKMIYCLMSNQEIGPAKELIHAIDSTAFVSIFNVTEASGEGFTFGDLPSPLGKKKKKIVRED